MLIKYPKQIGVGDAVISPYAKKLVSQVLNSGRLSYGPMSKEFERQFAKIHQKKFA